MSYVKAFESYRLTDRQADRHDRKYYYIPRRFAGGQNDEYKKSKNGYYKVHGTRWVLIVYRAKKEDWEKRKKTK